MNGKVLGIVFWFLTICILSSFVPSTLCTVQVEILSHSGWYVIGNYQVVGEVMNVGDTNANFVNVTVTFYDSSDQLLDSLSWPIPISILKPSRKSPFQVVLEDPNKAQKVDHYSLNVEYSVYQYDIPIGLEIVSSSYSSEKGEWTPLGEVQWQGEIKNIGDEATTNVWVMATFYDENGTVIDADVTLCDPSNIEPNETASFDETRVMPNEKIDLIADYALTAESDQYAIIPEFLSFLILPLFMISTLLAVIVYRRKHSIKHVMTGWIRRLYT